MDRSRGRGRKNAGYGRKLAMVVVLLGLVLGTLPAAFAAPASQGTASIERVYALTASGRLVSFDRTSPGTLLTNLTISGLGAGESLVGMDFRPADGMLYGVSTASQLYTISLRSGVATAVGTPFSPALSGSSFGVDFNPVVDKLRIVSNSGQNLRINPDGTLLSNDTMLSYNATDRNAGKQPNVVGAAYLNPDIDPATGTTLYDIDSGLDVLTTQAPPNDGILNTIGGLGIDANEVTGFDIGATNVAYAAIQRSGSSSSRLYSVNLASGRVSTIGPIAGGELIVDIAVSLNAANIGHIFALTSSNRLLAFDRLKPSEIRQNVAITGLGAGESLVGMDFRPANGLLYAVSTASQLYTINLTTGAATAVGTPFSPALEGTAFGVDFNPAVDKLRIVSNSGQNLRINPDGTLLSNDAKLGYGATDRNAGKQPNVVGAAYANPDTDPATGTTLYDIDSGLDVLTTQAPPNDGTLNTIGTLGVNANDLTGFDIGPDGSGSFRAFAAIQRSGSSSSRFYTVNLDSGRVNTIGTIGGGETILDIAAFLG